MSLHPFARILVAVTLPLLVALPATAGPRGLDPVTVPVFHRDGIHFNPEHPDRYASDVLTASDNGRVLSRTVTLAPPDGPCEIVARVRIHPIPNGVNAVCDKWDRAGNVRLSLPGMPDVELIKFITAYGGFTEHEQDVTHLAPLLRGPCTIRASIDTWVSPAWLVDFELVFRPVDEDTIPEWMAPWLEDTPRGAPDFARGVLYAERVTREDMDGGDLVRDVDIPEDAAHVTLFYLASGHCTDGRDEDEFVTKDNVITVAGREVHRLRPWRTDCRSFRDRNPYCRRWFDGSWSADYDRSGWCPGDVVKPVEIDLTAALPPGRHTLGFRVEGIRPRGDDDQLGYWRLSAHVAVWTAESGS